MSKLRSNAKLNGLFALKGSWIKAIISLAIIALLGFGISKLDDAYRLVFNIPRLTPDSYINANVQSFLIEAVFSIISFLVLAPLVLGMLEWYWNLTSGKHTGVGDIFAWYGSLRLYKKSILLPLNIFLRSILWTIVALGIPSAILAASSYFANGVTLQTANLSSSDLQNILIAGILMILGILLTIGGTILYIFIMSRYIPAFFLMVEDNTRGIRDVVRDSVKYTHNFRWEITKFVLSFIGWAILCLALVPILYVVPYFCSSLTILSKHIIYSQRPHEDIDATKPVTE